MRGGGQIFGAMKICLLGWEACGVALSVVVGLLTGCAEERPSAAQMSGPVTIHFEAREAGQTPEHFTTALTGGGGPVSWVVRADPTSPDGGAALKQESADDTSYRFPLCIYDGAEARDVAVTVKWKGISGEVDEAGGIVLRYRPENYYIARANVLEGNVDLFETVNGKRAKIVEVPVHVSGGQWHTLRFEARGPRLIVLFDGQKVIEQRDHRFSRAGKVGLWTKADSVGEFADFEIEPLP